MARLESLHRRYLPMVLFVYGVLCTGTVVAGQAERATGTVRDVTGSPLAGVTIALGGAADRSATTGRDGRFDFRGLPAGEYELTADLEGFARLRRSFRLGSGEPPLLELTLSVLFQEMAVVTATKTGEREAQKTPMAISVLSGAELQRAQADTVASLAGLAPSVTFSQNSDFAQLTIRGIGTNAVFAGSDPSSAVYLDGVYLARPVMVLGDFLDLERVEVLRGPQGTLYGRNAMGGAVNMVTKAPTNALEVAARAGVGNLDEYRAEARVSGPLIRDRVLGAAAVLRGVRSGFVRAVNQPDHALGGEDVTAVRGKLLVAIDRRSELLLSADATHQDPTPLTYAKVLAVKPGFLVDNPADLHEVRASTLAEGRIFQYGATVRFTSRLSPATTLTSLTAYRTLDYHVIIDADITELDLTSVSFHDRQHQWSEEFTIAQDRGRLAWIAGLFLFDEADHQPVSIQLRGPRLENRLDTHLDAGTGAVFGQATVGLARRVSATAGLRYNRERKHIENAGQLAMLDPPMGGLPGTAYAYSDSIAYSAWMPKLGLEVRARENLLAYGSASRGFKSGGFNFTSPVPGRGYAPESAWSYEAGVKSQVAGGRAALAAAAFRVDYTDLQVQTAILPGVIDISNAAEATIRGFELEGSVRLGAGVHAGGHLSWLDTRYDRYIAVGVGGVTGDAAGRRLSNTPEWSNRLWIEWTGAARSYAVSLRADGRSQSTVYFTPFNDVVQRQTPYGLLDVSAEIGPKRRAWSVIAWARNLTGADYITGTFSTPPPAIGGRPGPTRQAGIQLAFRR